MSTVADVPYPLFTEPILVEKVWGGRRLAEFGKTLPPGVPVGESWEVADLAATSPDGAGGFAARSVVGNGILAGRSLHEVMERWGSDLLGETPPTSDGGFPLLVKLLDARENLSVQVHPRADWVADHPGSAVKTESWLVLEAAPGASILKGVVPGTTRRDFEAARGARTTDLLARVPARPGDFHHLPAGTIHALGAGVVVAEVQTPSDTTFRLYDWTEEYGRQERALHVEQALENAIFEPGEPPLRAEDAPGNPLVETDQYTIRLVKAVDGAHDLAFERPVCSVLLCTGGVAALTDSDGARWEIPKGTTCIVPAAPVTGRRLVLGPGATAMVADLGGGPSSPLIEP